MTHILHVCVRKNSIFHIRNRGSIGLIKIMFKWVEWSWQLMASMMPWCHAIICHAMYLSIGVWETNKPVTFESKYMGRQYHQIRGIRVTKDWYFSIILNSTPMIFRSLWIKGEFTIFDLQLNFLARFDERKIFESCFLMQNPWQVT